MTNTSATGGVLLPVGTQQSADLPLDQIIQRVAAGILGFTLNNVLPRWQSTEPSMPSRGTDWCAIGVTDIDSDTNAVLAHDSQPTSFGPGLDNFIRHEQITVLASLYGPNSVSSAAQLRDGLAVPQNRETLGLLNIAYVFADPIRRVPSLINQGWINRADIRLTFRRKIQRTYPVLNLLSADGVVNGDNTFTVENPAS